MLLAACEVSGTLAVYQCDYEQSILPTPKADYSKVDEAIAKANALNKNDYKDFSAVEAAVNAVVRDKDISEQAEVDAMAAAIEAAIAGLEKRPEMHYYSIIEGANGGWIMDSDETLTFRANGDFSKYIGVKIDDNWLDYQNFTAVSGSTVITLKADYLKTLSEKTYKLTVVFSDGEASTNFEVKKASSTLTGGSDVKSPKTGDDSMLTDSFSPQTSDNSLQIVRHSAQADNSGSIVFWIALLLVSGCAFLGVIVYCKKKHIL